MYVYKIKPLHFTKAREVVSYFTTVNALALVMHSLRDKAEIQRIKYVLHEGLAVAQKFGCTENDAIKRKKYSDVHITFLTSEVDSWLMDADKEAPIIFWETDEITFMLSEQKLNWLDSYAQCMFGIVGPDDRVFPSQEAIEAYLKKISAQNGSVYVRSPKKRQVRAL
jgi:hypothetical protein